MPGMRRALWGAASGRTEGGCPQAAAARPQNEGTQNFASPPSKAGGALILLYGRIVVSDESREVYLPTTTGPDQATAPFSTRRAKYRPEWVREASQETW